MITIHDVRGTPLPGPHALARTARGRGAPFEAALRQLAPAAPSAEATRTAALGRPAATVAATPPASTRAAVAVPRAQAKERLVAAIRNASAHAGVDPVLSVAVARAESNLDPTARSGDGLSVGTFQVTHYTRAEMHRKIAAGIVERPPGTDDVALGVGYLRYLDDIFARDARLTATLRTARVADPEARRRFVVAAFNAGEGRVAQAQARVAAAGGDPTDFAALRPHLPRITRAYVDRVLTSAGDGGGAYRS